MFCSTTEDFIYSPLSGLLEEAVNAMSAVGDGMMGYRIADWVMPTVFLRMTGAQEQKFKCIYWDLGSVDLTHRYQRYTSKMGEMSCYDDKFALCKELLSFIRDNDQDFDPSTSIERQDFINIAKGDVERICNGSVVKEWYAADYKAFEEVITTFHAKDLIVFDKNNINCTALLTDSLKSAFDSLYNHRNRCAHNSNSYHKNLPQFKALSGRNARYENYFISFFMLITLDNVFMSLYKKAVSLVDLD